MAAMALEGIDAKRSIDLWTKYAEHATAGAFADHARKRIEKLRAAGARTPAQAAAAHR